MDKFMIRISGIIMFFGIVWAVTSAGLTRGIAIGTAVLGAVLYFVFQNRLENNS